MSRNRRSLELPLTEDGGLPEHPSPALRAHPSLSVRGLHLCSGAGGRLPGWAAVRGW